MRFNFKATILLLPLFLFACQSVINKVDVDGRYKVISDLETTVDINGDLRFTSNYNGFSIGNARYASNDFALSGKQSLKLNENQVYGLNAELSDLKPGEFVRISVWQKNGAKDGALMVTVNGQGYVNKFRTYNKKNLKQKDGWFQHYLTFTITENVDNVLIYVFSGKKEAYFDDICIEVFPQAPSNSLEKRINIHLPDVSQTKMNAFRSDALTSEIIADKNKKYVKAYIIEGDDSLKIKMKLKGDWTDHLKSGKTSYRIKLKGNDAYQGLKSFSIQHPKTRNYIHEWILHKIAEREDVLTTTYDFINVSINGFDFGIYALEEHFDKQLIESRNRREGPILKLDESGAWALNYKRAFFDKFCNLPYFESSIVSVFKQNRTLKDQRLRKNFLEGSSLLLQYKNGANNIEDIFDIDQLAKFYVLLELSSHNHALAWHNRRFYFNPVTQLLEPILYDAIPHAIRNDFGINIEKKLLSENSSVENVFDNKVFLNEKFKNRFMYYLGKLTTESYTDSIFEAIDPELNAFVDAIHNEDESYYFDKTEYYRNATFLAKRIPVLDSIWESMLANENLINIWPRTNVYKPAVDSFFVKEISVNAFLTTLNSGQFELSMENFHANPISVIGYSVKEKDTLVYFDEPLSLKGYEGKAYKAIKLCNELPSKLLLRVSNVENKIIKKTVIPYSRPTHSTTKMRLNKSFSIQSDRYKLKNNVIQFRGNVIVDHLIFIPKQFEVEVLAGSQIEFKNGGGLIVNNRFSAIGSKDHPISFSCTDSSSQGITILNNNRGGKGTTLIHVSFSGLSNLNYENWELTGAVNIYESPTLISHVTINNNNCEDALNIIRSTFKIDHLRISNTFSDGFDADFCEGVISDSQFENTGNDCIDFSGSIVTIEGIDILNSGDKGISGGEGSQLVLNDISVNGAITGIASKDESVVLGKNIKITNAEYGFAAFQKKGEYAPAKIVLTNAQWSFLKELKLVGRGSEIGLNGKETIGTQKIDIDQLYSRFEKK